MLVATSAALLAALPASASAPIALHWNELAPRCNTAKIYAADNCGKLRYTPALRITWGTLTLNGTSFAVTARLRNISKTASVKVETPVLCSYSALDSHLAIACSKPPKGSHTVRPGQTWSTTYRGTEASFLKGNWLRFGTIMSGTAGGKQLWAFPTNTNHAYHNVPGGKSGFFPIGAGSG